MITEIKKDFISKMTPEQFSARYKSSEEYLIEFIPDLFSYKTVLYIGACETRHLHLEKFFLSGYSIDVLEAWYDNCQWLQKFNKEKNWIRKIIWNDVRELETGDVLDRNYDIVFFWHGLEHIFLEQQENTIKWLKYYTDKLLVLGCPYGNFFQGEVNGNPYEKHLCSIYSKDLENLGFDIIAIGYVDDPWGYLIGFWKRDENK